jgi:hypothetical protein
MKDSDVAMSKSKRKSWLMIHPLSRPSWRVSVKRISVVLGTIALLVTVLGLWGCTTTIVPPQASLVADNPVHVHIADYGRHSTIMLPLDDSPNRMVEYGFGEWRFFGHNEEGVGGVLRALLIRSDGTISRRFVTGPFEEQRLRRQLGFVNFYTITVHRDDAVALRVKLDDRYDANIETEIFNARHQLHFVKVDEQYALFNNCNPVLARWLRQLNCEVRGPALLSSWRIREQP